MTNAITTDILWEEFREYTANNRMSSYERRILRNWVRSGHSVYDTVESRYLPGPSYPPMDFLDAYRLDRELSENMKGMTIAEKNSYLKSYTGYEEPPAEVIAMNEAKKNTPKLIEDRVRHLERELFHLWEYIWQEGLGDEAREFMEEHKDEEIPFEW